MPLQYNIEAWKKTDKWLRKNAPPYVIECVEELTKTLLDYNLLFMRLDGRFRESEAGFIEALRTLDSLKATLEERRKILDEILKKDEKF